ncbi:MAG: outer membrane protein assembly factor BamD, partial [Verrucomicrobiales bacterium]
KLAANRQFIENLASLNVLIVAMGDKQAEKEEWEDATRTYSRVIPREQVIEFQEERIRLLEEKIQAAQTAAARAPQGSVALFGQIAQFQPILDQARALLTEFKKLPDYTPGLLLRTARCWYGRNKKWEAILVNDRILERYPDARTEREAAMYGNVICYADLMQVVNSQLLCTQYLKEFPKGPNAGTVAYVQGAVAFQSGDISGAASLFGSFVETQPDSKFIDQMFLQLAAAHFSLGDLDESKRTYQRYIEKFPTGEAVEEAKYRAAIIPVFQGKYEEGWKTVEAFLKENPQSEFAQDAEYRLMICKYAAELYEVVLKDAAKWQENHPKGLMMPEVLSLKGDCLAGLSKEREAADAYEAAANLQASEEVIDYALTEASKLLQKLGDLPRLSRMWEDFIKDNPNHTSVVAGIFWIGKAKTKEGKI